jgi:proteasome lid subunit RPN8/RPN11
VYRKALVEWCKNDITKTIIESFLPGTSEYSFQPIPGCSEPTYTGSSADLSLYASAMLNSVAQSISHDSSNAYCGAFSRLGAKEQSVHEIVFDSGLVCDEFLQGYKTCISNAAWQEIVSIIKEHSVKNRVETGGLLFGERNDILNMIWIDKVSGPPPDSKATTTAFICGVEGVSDLNKQIKSQFHRMLLSIGTWHTHPKSLPFPSPVDLMGMASILHQKDLNRERNALLIMQPTTRNGYNIGTFLFLKNEFVKIGARTILYDHAKEEH